MLLNSTIISINEKFPPEVAMIIAGNVKRSRLELNLTQTGLAERAGVKLPTYRKFERTGEISLMGLLKIASALGVIEEFESLFVKKQYETLEDVINGGNPGRKRGKKK